LRIGAQRGFNILCLAGIVLSLVPIAVSWMTADTSLPLGVGRQVSVIDLMTDKVTASCPCLLMSATIFATATLFLIVTPLAALVQFAGIGVFFIGAPFSLHCGGAYCIWQGNAGAGLVVAASAATLSLIGMVLPLGLTKNLKIGRLKGRMITIGKLK